MGNAAADAYVGTLGPGRREAITTVRALVNHNLQPGFEEGTGYSMGILMWRVPADVSPKTYNNAPIALAALGNWQNYMSLYLMALVHDPPERAWFERAWRATGKRLDAGRITIRFRKLDDLALDVVAEHIRHTTVDGLIAAYELAWAR